MSAAFARVVASPPAAADVPPKKVPRHPIEHVLKRAAPWVPRAVLSAGLAAALGDLKLTLCFHRVGVEAKQWTMPPAELDRMLELLTGSRPPGASRWLTLAFDDGYADAVDYVASRARRHPDVEWLVFVCPAKAEHRLGYQWDAGSPCELASVEALRALQRVPNVELGNHTSSHLVQMLLDDTQAAEEYESSTADFRRLFGVSPRHFAFPFGTPQLEFEQRHVELLRRISPGTQLWSTERRPYDAAERVPGAVLPRFSVDSTWSSRQVVLWVSAHAVKYRLKGTPHHF
ncbi:MAG: polysaccharide deacetylase family protein [Myxococcaceae bacterium]|nr:polysaccharide deacetylase family protein [Myxococcaceae bacterium]